MSHPQNDPASHLSEAVDARPFLIYIRHRDQRGEASWRPDAFVGFSRGLRASGLLGALPAEDLQSLLYILSFLTPDGQISPGTLQLAEAFGLPQARVYRRLERLAHTAWAGGPLVQYRRFESGLDAFVPQAGLFTVEEETNSIEPKAVPSRGTAPREAIIARSREAYAHPRAEVEEIVRRQLRPLDQPLAQPPGRGSKTPVPGTPAVRFSAEQRQAMEQLAALGVNVEQAASLLARFDLPRIRRQVAWLPHRGAKNPAAYLIAAIERDYEAPRGLPRRNEVATTRSASLPSDQSPDAPPSDSPSSNSQSHNSQPSDPPAGNLSPASSPSGGSPSINLPSGDAAATGEMP